MLNTRDRKGSKPGKCRSDTSFFNGDCVLLKHRKYAQRIMQLFPSNTSVVLKWCLSNEKHMSICFLHFIITRVVASIHKLH